MHMNLQITAVRKISRMLGIWLWVIVFSLLFSLLSPYYLSFLNFVNIAKQTSIFGIMAIGMTLVIITGGIDLSVGSIVSFSSAVFGVVWASTQNTLLSIGAALAVGLLFGLLNGYLVGYVKLPPFIATFGTMGICAGFAFALTTDSIGGFTSRFETLGNGTFLRLPVPLFVLIAVALIMHYLLKHTVLGLRIYAVGGSEAAAVLSGVSQSRIKLLVYAVNGLLASLAAVIICARIRSAYPGIGDGFELTVIASTVIGGTVMSGGYGKIAFAVGGAFFVAMIQNIFNLLGIYPFMQNIILGVFIVAAVLASKMQEKKSTAAGI